MNFLTKRKQFSNGIGIHATYYLQEGKVWLAEEWSNGIRYYEPEPWDTDDVEAVARHHNWEHYIEVPYLRA